MTKRRLLEVAGIVSAAFLLIYFFGKHVALLLSPAAIDLLVESGLAVAIELVFLTIAVPGILSFLERFRDDDFEDYEDED